MFDLQKYLHLCEQQKSFFKTGATRSYASRFALLNQLEQGLKDFEPEILEALKKDMNKPKIEAYLSEIYFTLSEVRLAKKNLKKWMVDQKVASPFFQFLSKSWVRYEPFGLSLIIGPWNYPVQLTLGPLVSALAAGNVAVIKPSEFTVNTSQVLHRMIKTCFDPKYVRCILGDSTVAEQIMNYPYDKVFFTGSTNVGRKVAQKAAGYLTPVTLELGGKSPTIVDDTFSVALASKRILMAKLFNSGQTCVAPDFVCVQASVYDNFINEYAKSFQNIALSTQIQKNSTAMIHNKHFDHLDGLVKMHDPSKVMVLAEKNRGTLFYPPTLLLDVSWQDPVMKEEVFGPILPILKYHNQSELIERLQAMDAPLALYVFSHNQLFVEKLLNQLPSGGVTINDAMKNVSNIHLPFGGVGKSGMGSSHGRFGFKSFSHSRGIVKKFGRDFFTLKVPNEKTFQFLRKFLK